MDKHSIYCLKLEDTPFYVGYVLETNGRTLEDRLKEHIQSAKNPTKEQLENRAIRGGPTDKEKWILAALEDEIELTIEKIHTAELWEAIDEDYFIKYYKEDLQHPITNIAKGLVHQPFIRREDGTLVETSTQQEVDEVQLRKDIQDWKKRGKQPVVKCFTPPKERDMKAWNEQRKRGAFVWKRINHYLQTGKILPNGDSL